jgi:alpha-tubulin suppressor-like RCC1 family protein
MVPTPDPPPTGEFDGTLAPDVWICIWDGSECRADVAMYNTETGPASETIRVVHEDEHYMVNWHTDDILENFGLEEGETYRIRVLVGLQVLGYADVEVVSSGGALKNVDTEELIPLKDGRTLPIKFRIEEGALVSGELVSAGGNHSCAVDVSGDAYCWGSNFQGQLGTGSLYPTLEPTPVAVTGGHKFQSVSAGASHTCGVTTDGDAYCWGFNLYGQLGTGSVYPYYQATPVAVTGGYKFQSVSAGAQYTCGVTTDGDAYCWGFNGYGSLGIGSVGYIVAIPVAVTGGHEFQSVRALWWHACGLTTDGNGFCWGYNYHGQVGDGTDSSTGTSHERKPSPTAVGGDHTFQSLDAGWIHSCGVTTAGDALCWGYNRHGQVGDGTTSPVWPYNKPSPTAVTGGITFHHVSAGFHSCGLATDGAAYCWGYNRFGELGDGTFSSWPDYGKANPVAVIGGQTFQSISAGYYHTCGVTPANDGYCWGWGGYGQVGSGTYTNKSSPVFVLDLDPPTP